MTAQRVLVVAPHPDDESIGCGGMIALHRDAGDDVAVVFLTSGERGIPGMAPHDVIAVREAEARAAARLLSVAHVDFLRQPDHALAGHVRAAAAALAPVLAARAPTLVYLPHALEAHPDHRAALPIVRRALASPAAQGARPELCAYEVWTPMPEYGWSVDVGAVMARKLRAVRCHASQLAGFRYDRAVRGLNAYRGELAARCRYAEVFRSEPA